jgi:F420-dependent oxidoreductase-like protein
VAGDDGSTLRNDLEHSRPATLPVSARAQEQRVKLGLQIASFTWPGGTEAIGPTLARVVRAADDAGFDSIWVMDHFFQIRVEGPTTDPMLEGYTTLGFMAAHSSRARLGLMVGGVHYRQPGLWVKATTTLDVLSGGRAWLGIGAAWNKEESDALGFPFPDLGVRFELLEETLRFAHGMWQGELGTGERLDGPHLHAGRMLNSPQAISRPHPPIMIGGGGERKTLRLVAQYADATNVFGGPEGIAHKYRVLREHCERLGRPYEEIERSTLQRVTLSGGRAETPAQIVDRFGELADAGAQHVILSYGAIGSLDGLELLGHEVIPRIRSL